MVLLLWSTLQVTMTTTTAAAAAVAEFSSVDSGSSLPYEMQRWMIIVIEKKTIDSVVKIGYVQRIP
jgi:hypothetical protein